MTRIEELIKRKKELEEKLRKKRKKEGEEEEEEKERKEEVEEEGRGEEVVEERTSKKRFRVVGKVAKAVADYIEPHLPYFVTYEIIERDGILRVRITPKPGYEYKFEVATPFEYEIVAPPPEWEKERKKEWKKAVSEVGGIILDRFYISRVKAPHIINLEILTRKLGDRERALEIFAYLCQKGSPYHSSFLYGYLYNLICGPGKILDVTDESERRYLADYVVAAGFKKLADILAKLDVGKLTRDQKEKIKRAVRYGLKEVLSKYAPVYESPEDLSESDREKAFKVMNEACKLPEYKWEPSEFDETPIIEALGDIASEIPPLRRAIEEAEMEEITSIEERVERIEEELKKLVEEMRRLEEEKRKLKEKLKRRMERLE